MNRLFIYFAILMTFSFISIGCTSDDTSCKVNEDCNAGKVCINNKCETDDTSGQLLFIGLTDGDFIDGYRNDIDGTQSGVQIDINVKGVNINDSTDVSLMIEGDENSKVTKSLKTLDDSSSIVTFSRFTLKDGENKLILTSVDKYNKDVKTEITVTSKELSLSIVSPTEGTVLREADDKDSEKYYIQKDVVVNVDGLVSGNAVNAKLVLFEGEVARFSYLSEPKDGVIVFENVDFREGDWKLVASINTLNNSTISSDPISISAEALPGGCRVDVTPSTGETINQKYLSDNNIIDKKIPFKIDSSCPIGFKVRFTLNGVVIDNKTLVEENGKAVAETIAELPEDADLGTNSVLNVDVSEDFNNPDADGGFITANYFVDTVGPKLEVTFPSENYEFFAINDFDPATPGMQFTVSGNTEDATSLLKVAVDNNPAQEFVGAIDESTQLFNTNLLADNKFVTVLGDGEHTLKFTAYDVHENETTVSLPIKVYLTDINISLIEIATKAIDENTTELKLNQSDDQNVNLENVQFTVSGMVTGLDAGREMGLYVNDIKILQSNIETDGKVNFNLNTAELGLEDGVYDIYIKTIENNGPKSKTIKLFVSNTKPVLLLTGISDGDYTNISPMDLNITTTGLSGDDEQVHLNLNNVDLTSVTVDDQGFAVFTNIAFQDGANVFNVTASDFEGNEAEPLNFTINYDNTNPNVVITAPINGSTLTRAEDSNLLLPGVQVVVNVDIDNEIDGTEVKLFLGTNELATTTVLSHKATFTDVTLQSSIENILKVKVTDQAGNFSESQVSITVDDGCYNLQFLSPTLDNAKLNDTSFAGTVNVGPSGTNNLAPNSLPLVLTVSGNTFNSTITGGNSSFNAVSLAQGDNTLVLSYDVDASTHCEASVMVNYDTSTPVISSLSIIDKLLTSHAFSSGDSVNLGTMYDVSIATDLQTNIKLNLTDIEAGQVMSLKVDGADKASSAVQCDVNGDNCFVLFSSLTFLEGGPYSLLFSVKDVNGNKSNDYLLTLNVDITTPVVAFDADFPISLNASVSVDEQSSILGLQYSVKANLSNINAGDTVKFYIDGSLAKMRLNSNLNAEIDAEHILSNGQTSYTFENVTFPLNALDGDNNPIPYQIKLVVSDSSQNKTEDIKANYKVLNGLDVYFSDSLYKTRNKKKINTDNTTLSIGINRAEQGVMSLSVSTEDDPNTIISTLNNNMNGVSTSSSFTLTKTSEILTDGRYLLAPKFTDQSNFEYTSTIGYLAVKRTKPTVATLSITNDLNNNGILNKSEDGNSTLAGFQSNVVVTLNNTYLDADDCAVLKRTLELRQGNENGTLLGSGLVNCDGTITISATFPESSTPYQVYATLVDSFDNILSNNNQGSVLVDVTAPTVTNVVSANKSFANNIKFLANEDTDSGLSGFQNVLTVSTSGSASLVRVEATGFMVEQSPIADSTDFGTVTIADGVYDVVATAIDAAGNSSSVTFTNVVVDTLIPILNLSIASTSITDSDDTDNTTPGIQYPVTVNNMANIENGQTVYIESDNSGSWASLKTFVKDANNSKTITITLPQGNNKLRARALDVNSQVGLSSEVAISVVSATCSFNYVKNGTTTLVSGSSNYFNNNDLQGGNVSLTVSAAQSCTGYNLLVKKDGVTINTLLFDSEIKTVSIPFSNGDTTDLSFTIETKNVDSSIYPIIVDTISPTVEKTTPINATVSYVNNTNPLIDGSTIIGDTSSSTAGAQVTISVTANNADGGTIEMISNDGTSDTSHETKNISSDAFNAIFTGQTLADNKTHTISFKVTDIAGNVSTTQLYTATVDVTNPGALSLLDYDAITDTERRKADINLIWNQTATGDDGNVGSVAKYVIKYSTTPFDETNFETLTNNGELTINAPDLTANEYQQLIQNLIFQKDYTIGVRAYDELGNASNLVSISTGADLNLLGLQLDTTSFDTLKTIEEIKAVGDINDDGFNDFVVTQASTSTGKVFIYYGKGDMTFDAPQVLVLPASYRFGFAITSGDFDGDGKRDLIVGAPYSNTYTCSFGVNKCRTGYVYVFYNQGSGLPIDSSGFTLVKNIDLETEANLGGGQYAKFGTSVSLVGKINGSSSDSFILGQSGVNGGTSFIIQGRSGRPAEIDVINDTGNTVELSHDFGATGTYGETVSGLGDVDSNGTPDVVVGDSVSKKVAVFHLDSNLYTNTTLTALSDNSDPNAVVLSHSGANYGITTIGNIDLNNDGNKDLVVSALTTGVYIYYGNGSKLTSTQSFIKINSPTVAQTSWNNNIAVSDFNGDNKDDIVIGADKKLNIYLSKTNNFTTGVQADIILDGTSNFEPDATGILKSGAYDANEDGINDFVICDLTTRNCFIKY